MAINLPIEDTLVNYSAKIISDSISPDGIRLRTFEVEFPRLILAEWNTHKMHSKNAASTRAIPLSKQLELISTNPVLPLFYGKNQAGMVANEELEKASIDRAREVILRILKNATEGVEELANIGLHKQSAGRYVEPWGMVKGVVSATEFDNFFYLRRHYAAQPEIHRIADLMWEASEKSTPELLHSGEWHTPYVKHYRDSKGVLKYLSEYRGAEGYQQEVSEVIRIDGIDYQVLSKEDALVLSAACCAGVSYRKQDMTLEKAREIFSKLIESKPCHASPVEHQASPVETLYPQVFFNGKEDVEEKGYISEGVTHFDRRGRAWSANFLGWVQYRKLIPDDTCWEYRA